MINISINNHNLYLLDNTDVQFEFFFPVISEDKMPGARALWFELPVCPVNDFVFGALRQNTKTGIRFDALLSLAGQKYNTVLIVREILPNAYKCCIVFNTFISKYGNLSLRELPLAGYSAADIETRQAKFEDQKNKFYPEAEFALPCIAVKDFYDDETSFENVVNAYNVHAQKYRQNATNETGTYNITSYVPMPYLRSVFDAIKVKTGYKVTGDFFDLPETNKLIVFSNKTLDYISAPVSLQLKKEEQTYFHQLFVPAFDEIKGTGYDITGKYYTIPNDSIYSVHFFTEFWQGVYSFNNEVYRIRFKLVNISTNTVVFETQTYRPNEKPFSFSKLNGTGEFYAKKNDKIQFVIEPSYNPLANANTSNPIAQYAVQNMDIVLIAEGFNMLNSGVLEFDLARQLPDISISEMFKGIAAAFGLAVFFDENAKTIELGKLENIVQSPDYAELPPEKQEFLQNKTEPRKLTYSLNFNEDSLAENNFKKPDKEPETVIYPPFTIDPRSAGRMVKVLPTNKLYVSTVDPEKETFRYEVFSDMFYPVTEGSVFAEKEEKPEAAVGTLTMNYFAEMKSDGFPEHFPVPQAGIKADSPTFKTAGENKILKLLLYNGLQKSKNGFEYPMASSMQYSPTGSEINSFSICMSGQNGLYERFLKKWTDRVVEGKTLTLKLQPDNADFFKLVSLFLPQNSKTPVRKLRYGQRNYIPLSLKMTVSTTGITAAEIVLT